MGTTTRLSTQLEELKKQLDQGSSEKFIETQAELLETLKALGIGRDALTVGDQAPNFTLPDQVGADLRLSDLLKLGSVVLSFFRGAWCPFCETELKALHMALPEIERRGGRLLAVSPQTLDKTMSMAERLLLDYSILVDAGNSVAKEYGLAFTIPEKFQEFHDVEMARIAEYNGDLSYLLPIPATYVIDTEGVIRYAYVDVDYRNRAEPEDVLHVLDRIHY
jgi:peroxiredoxin